MTPTGMPETLVQHPDDEGWKCPAHGCDRPLSDHLVSLATRNLQRAGRRTEPPEQESRRG